MKETALIEACRVVLASVVATALAAITLWLLLPGYRTLVAQSTANTDAHVQFVGVALITAGLACGYVLLASVLRWPGKPPIDSARVWHRAFAQWPSVCREKKRARASALLIVELLDGTVWKGVFGAADSDPEDSHRNLALQQPLSRKRPGEQGFIKKDVGAVLLPEREIRSVQAKYLVSPERQSQPDA